MSSRYRIIWTSLSRLAVNYKNVPIVSLHVTKRNFAVPCTMGFSVFTWLGFDDKKLSAEDQLIDTIKHCVLFIQRMDYVKAEQLLHIALRHAQQLNHELGVTYIYDVMANLALERVQLEKAKKLFVAVSQRLMANDGATEDDSRIVYISVKLARISHLQKDFSTAQLGYDWCIQKLTAALNKETSEETIKILAVTEDWYGRMFLENGQNEQALTLMTSALERMRQVPDVEQEHIVIQLNDIGTVYDNLNKTDESIFYFKEAIKLGKPLDMEDLGAIYVNLGQAYIKKKLLDDARKNCGHAWKLSFLHKNESVKQEAEECLSQIKNLG